MALRTLCINAVRGLSVNLATRVAWTSTRNSVVIRKYDHCIERLLSTTLTPSNGSLKKEPCSQLSQENFTTIYKFPYIRQVSTFLKIRYACLRVVPVAVALSYLGITSVDSSVFVCLVGLNVYLLGLFTKNMVGFIYANPDMSNVKIAYVDNQGKRVDDVIPSTDIVPMSELKTSKISRHYVHLERFSKPSTKLYKLSLRHSEFTDMERFINIFGNVDV